MNKRIFLLFSILLLAIGLRFFYYTASPPALFTDEADQGYNAYSLLKTGRDEHGVFLPVSLRSFGDWKPPMQTYLSIPFIWLFGLEEFNVRLPSMILGLFSIFVAYSLVKRLGLNEKIGLLLSFFLTISPWHIHQSRSAMLVLVALFFFLTGFAFFLKGVNIRKNLIISTFHFSLAIYAYYGMRLIVPLFIFCLLFFYRKNFPQPKKAILVSTASFFIFLSPLLLAFFQNPDVVFGRAKTVSVFYDQGINLRLWEFASEEGSGHTFMARLYHNKLYAYAIDITRRFFSHLDGVFLFLGGDAAPPFLIPNMGVFYLLDGIFLITGMYYLIKSKKRIAVLILLFLATSLVPASLTFMTPSSNRTFSAVFPLLFIATFGLYFLTSSPAIKVKKLGTIMFVIVTLGYTAQFSYYLYEYYRVLPKEYSDQWAYGFKQMVRYVDKNEGKYDQVVILPHSNIAYIYFLFYSKVDPGHLESLVVHDYIPDQFGFEHVSQMGKYIFLRHGTLSEAKLKYTGRTLFVGTEDETKEGYPVEQIRYPNDSIAFRLTE